MSNRKPCIRCGRSIDEYAKICPFCNWDQTMIAPPPEERAAAAYVPPEQHRWWRGNNKVLGIIAFVALVIIAFVIGTLIHGFEPSEVKAAQTKTETGASSAATTPAPRSNVTLVPVTGNETAPPVEQPITTAPAAAPGQEPNDATALPAAEYAAAAARAKAQRDAEEKAKPSMIDPRSLTGTAYEQSQRPPAMASASSATPKPSAPASVGSTDTQSYEGPAQPESAPAPARTSAYLEYKPLPHINVDRDTTARLDLTVDANGRVTDIDVSEPVPEMPRLLAAVQNWRFKPATENGEPVTSHVSVDITFHANE